MTTSGSILIVDDQPDLLSNLGLTLEGSGFTVYTASNGTDALELLAQRSVDLILADIAMPQMNGYQLYEKIRDNPAWTNVPFLFLTARTLDSDIRYGKMLGVDDYLLKPIQPEDLLAAVQGKLRRREQLAHAVAEVGGTSASEQGVLEAGQLRIDHNQHRAWLGAEPLTLSAREFTLLEQLVRQVNTVVSPQDLIQATHGLRVDHEEAGTLLRPLIRSLRRKLGYPVGEIGCIEVVRGVGYRLTPPE
jgi:DNA-binding response OmpR family regulator